MPKIYDNLRQTIVATAKEIVVKDGYRKLNMRQVAKECGIAVGTIYNYFPTKDELLSELMYGYWMEFISAIQLQQKEEADLFLNLQKIYGILESFIDTFKDTWLKANRSEGGMTKEHHRQKDQVVELFVDTIAAAITEYKKGHTKLFENEIRDRELAAFIVQNFMLISQMKQFEYDTFEKILKSYFL